MGPLIKCVHPIVDFGLVKVNSTEYFDIQLENTSPVPAEVLIKSSHNTRLDFDNMMSAD